MCELPSCFTVSIPKARKRHKCCECRGFIEPGENYHRFSGVWDGSGATYKTCSDCETLRAEIQKKLDLAHDEPVAFQYLYEEMDSIEDKIRWVAIMEKRGATVHKSWREAIEKLLPSTTPGE